jgi:hypothetical protein
MQSGPVLMAATTISGSLWRPEDDPEEVIATGITTRADAPPQCDTDGWTEPRQ